MDFSPFEFALMVETHAGQRAHERSHRFQTFIAEDSCAASFIVIFHEAREAAMQCGLARDSRANFLNFCVAHGVVEFFVVGEGKAEIEQTRFRSPIGFSKQSEIWNGGMRVRPEFGGGRRGAAEESRPNPRANGI